MSPILKLVRSLLKWYKYIYSVSSSKTLDSSYNKIIRRFFDETPLNVLIMCNLTKRTWPTSLRDENFSKMFIVPKLDERKLVRLLNANRYARRLHGESLCASFCARVDWSRSPPYVIKILANDGIASTLRRLHRRYRFSRATWRISRSSIRGRRKKILRASGTAGIFDVTRSE